MRAKIVTLSVGLVAGLALGGFVGSWLAGRSNEAHTTAAIREQETRAEHVQTVAAALRERVALLEMHLRLGRIAIEADRQDYGSAGKQAARFFDDLAGISAGLQQGNPDRILLEHVLAGRDEITAGLATAQPAAAQRLEQLYLDCFALQHLQSPKRGGPLP